MLLDEQRQQINWKLREVAAGKVEQEQQVADTEDDTTISSLESDQEELQAETQPWYSQTRHPLRTEHQLELDLSGLSVTQLKSVGPSPSPDRVEDQPLGGGKTFAQLLAEQLAGNENEDMPVPDQNRKVVTPKPFLKRGAGLTRFNLPPDPAKQPGRIGSKVEPRSDNKVTEPKEVTPTTNKQLVVPKYLNKKNSSKEPFPVKSDNKFKPLPKQSPPSKLKLKPSTSTSELSNPRSQPPPRPAKFNLCDSVENSFCDKLSVQAQRQEKDLKELAVFQLLEDAANDSSFCSNSSKIKSLVGNAMLPSPNRMKNPNMSTDR